MVIELSCSKEEVRMSTNQDQTSQSAAFSIGREEGKAPGTVIFRLSGALTMRNMYAAQTPAVVREMFDLESMLPQGALPALNIFDLTHVPYMDSMGVGTIVSHYVRCKGKGVRMVAVGVSPRVMEVFKITKVDSVIPMTATVEEADAG
jgi:anti-anti-sigma factor